MRVVLAVAAGCVLAMSINSASASVITYDFSQLGTVYDNGGQLSATAGNGYVDVTAAFEANATAAATIWNRATFGIAQTLVVSVTLADLTSEKAVGDSLITSNDTAPNLPSTSNIRVNDGVGGALIYVPSDPFNNSAFNVVDRTANLNGNIVNVSRFGTAVSGGPADGEYDLLSLFLHEDGHSLGFTDDYGSNYANLLTASSPAGGCGSTEAGGIVGTEGALTVSAALTGSMTFNIPVLCSDPSHIDGTASNGLYNDATLADPGFGVNQRALITGLDIFGLCAADGATAAQCNQNPSFAADVSPTDVPEPRSLWMVVTSLVVIGVSTLFARRGASATTVEPDLRWTIAGARAVS